MNRKIRFTTDPQRAAGEKNNNSYLAVLSKIRNITGICSIDELKNHDHAETVKKAVSGLNADDFSFRQWRIATNFFIGKKTDISSSKQAFDLIIQKLSKKG